LRAVLAGEDERPRARSETSPEVGRAAAAEVAQRARQPAALITGRLPDERVQDARLLDEASGPSSRSTGARKAAAAPAKSPACTRARPESEPGYRRAPRPRLPTR
jgi:hypothetical protein